MVIAQALFSRNLWRLRQEDRKPRTYADNYADALAFEIFGKEDKGGEEATVWSWPAGKRCAIVLSHDVDTPGQTVGIERLRRVAERRGMESTFSFVGSNLAHYAALIRDLKAAGHEIALHDRFHDNQIAFLTEEQVVERLSPLRDAFQAYNIHGFRSPSWYTSVRLWKALRRLGFVYDMSVLDSWSFFESQRNYGVATLFPYRVDGLTILPNTIPFDDAPRFCGYDLDEILSFWRPKFDWIGRNGGLIMLNAHPDRWWSGSLKAAEAFEQSVQYILDQHDPARFNARGVAEHLDQEGERGSLRRLEGRPSLQLPRLRGKPVPFEDVRLNPIMTPRATFMTQETRE
jgi:peptidoglycan/xylan/chitin deacetylase (PgdA/CDA1 family)